MNAHAQHLKEGRYRALFGYQAGYLPADFGALLDWQRGLSNRSVSELAR